MSSIVPELVFAFFELSRERVGKSSAPEYISDTSPQSEEQNKLPEHECDLDKIRWSNEIKSATDKHNVNEKGACPDCGKEFELVFAVIGIWDVAKEQYVRYV